MSPTVIKRSHWSLDFHITFLPLPWESTQDHQDATVIFCSMYSTLVFDSYLEFEVSQVKRPFSDHCCESCLHNKFFIELEL